MSMRQHLLTFGHKKEGDGETVSCSTDTSRWSTPSRQCCSSPQCLSDCEDRIDLLIDRTATTPTAKCQRSKRTESRKAQKTNCTSNHQTLKLPPVKPLQAAAPKIPFSNMNCIKELESQVKELQQQLTEARTENKLLKKLQHRHKVALQYFQDSEGSISEILTNHNNEVRVLQELLRDTRSCRDNLARQLQTTENRLMNTKATLQHLQLLSQDNNLLEREELTLRLVKATAELEKKDKRIRDMERNLELCQTSFNRQINAEQKKAHYARKKSFDLQEYIYQLTKEIHDKEKELERHNIYSHRLLKGWSKNGRENKMVQTDALVFVPTQYPQDLQPVSPSLPQLCSKSEGRLEQPESSVNGSCNSPVQKSLVVGNPKTEVTAKENVQENTEICAGTTEVNICSKENPEEACAKSNQSEPMLVLDIKEESKDESRPAYILEGSVDVTEPKRKENKFPQIRQQYTFKQTTENLHNGLPAYSRMDNSPRESTKGGDG